MTLHTIQPIRKQTSVQASQDEAFDVFTRQMGTWWNPDYSIGDEPLADVVIEPREGGRWYERSASGSECDWGRVLAWDAPNRVVLAWQITTDWKFDPGIVTELEIRFVAEGSSTTRVELEHRGLEALGAQAEAIRGIFDSLQGWAGLLERFAQRAGG